MGPDLKLLVREVPGRRVKDRVSNVTTFKGMTTGAESSVSPVPVALGLGPRVSVGGLSLPIR